MPIYRIQCSCGHAEDVYRAVKDYDDLPAHCGQRMTRAVCAPMVITDIQPYKSMKTGEMITSRSMHRDHLKQHGLIEIGNEKIPDAKPKTVDRESVKQDIANVMNGMGL